VRILCVALLAGCAAAPRPVPLAGPWPTAPGSYEEVYERWTRRGEDRLRLTQTLAVSATLEGAEFRAAYAHERARRLGLSADQEAELVATERAADAEGWEVELLVATSFPELNDLKKTGNKDKGSMWHLALIADDGRHVDPVSVRPDKRHRDDVEAYFPDLQMFYVPYIVKFPRTSADGRPLVEPGAKHLTFEIGGSLGKVQLVWSTE
jgi:hypothetical protein